MDTQSVEHTVESMTDRELAEANHKMLTELTATLGRFMPLLDKYERAASAGNVFAARRAMKGA